MTLTRPCRCDAFAQAGEPFEVTEQDCHHPALAFRRGQVRAVDQPFDDTRIEIFAESLPDPLVVAQLHDHPVERGGQLPNFITRP